MDVVLELEDTHPSGLRPIARQPILCPNKNVKHRTDSLKEMHGSREQPIVVPEARNGKYVAWEYEHMGRMMPSPYKKCLQELLHEEATGRDFDRLVVRDIRGNHHVFYFDVTARLAEEGVRMKKACEDYEAGRPVNAHDREAIEAAIRVTKEAEKRRIE
jgi:hypothetical protein